MAATLSPCVAALCHPSNSKIFANNADKIVDGIDFGELCNDFECISSPLVESTARQLVRDILELRDDNRAFATLAISVKYRDPLRSFIGRDKYKRPLWARDALNNPSVSVQEMMMQSTSVLCIKWTIRGKPKSSVGGIAGDLILELLPDLLSTKLVVKSLIVKNPGICLIRPLLLRHFSGHPVRFLLPLSLEKIWLILPKM